MIDPLANLNALPIELLKKILDKEQHPDKRLQPKDLARLACVSKRMYQVVQNLVTWRWIFRLEYNERYCTHYSGLPEEQRFYELYAIEVRANKDLKLKELDAITKEVRETNEALLFSVTVMNPFVAPRIVSLVKSVGSHIFWLFQGGEQQSKAVNILSQTAHSILGDS